MALSFQRSYLVLLCVVIIVKVESKGILKGHATSVKGQNNGRVYGGKYVTDNIPGTMTMVPTKEMDRTVVVQKLEIPVDKTNVILDIIDNQKIPVLFYHNQHSNSILVETKSLYHQALDLVKYEVASLGSHNYVQIHIGETTSTASSTPKILFICVLSMLLLILFVVRKDILDYCLQGLQDKAFNFFKEEFHRYPC